MNIILSILLIIGLTEIVVIISEVLDNEKMARIAFFGLCIEGILLFVCLMFFIWFR